ncbi:MAG: SDR family oxidoreductase [Kordiimonadaceae bacterium]|nr:SDR family oxidoreductase [Kordiimonadaceae bacterium]
MRLSDKVAIITGAASGIGRGVAERFASEGAVVIVTDITKDAGAETVAQIQAMGGKAHFMYLDVSSAEQWEKVVAEVLEEHGHIDVLHNNAAHIIHGKTVIQTSEEDWDAEHNVTLKGTFLGCKAVLPCMIEKGAGSIINTSSTAGISGIPNFAAYSAAKGGVIQLTKSIAVDFGRQGIRANAICPGIIETPAIATLLKNDEWRNASTSRLLLNYIGKPDDIASAALYLASDESSFVTGSVTVVDGGRTIAY